MLRTFLFGILIILLLNSLKAQTPKYSNEFMSIGVGAKALGMSNTVTGHINDVSSGFWNPAGLVNVPTNMQLALMHAEYFAGIAKFDYGALALKIDEKSTAALSIVRFGVDDIPNTIELIDNDGNIDYEKIKSFSAVDFAFMLSYARKSVKFENLDIGASAKIIKRKAGNFANAWGFGFDVGAQYKYDKWLLGLFAKDITTTYNTWNYTFDDKMKEVFALTGNEIPSSSVEITLPKFILGAARSFNVYNDFSALAAIDIDITTDNKRNVLIRTNPLSFDPHIGLEFDFKKMVFLRTGLGNIQKETNSDGKRRTSLQINMGVGVQIGKILTIDYALTDIGNNSIALYSNIFSLKFNINRNE
ncbi:MAG: PorV/PorQ family protein [Bacteroidales bacterium]|nr:PorV/PorQ family protein [Bacteroidales bacterium]